MSYDSWLEAPYQRGTDMPKGVEDMLGVKVWLEGEGYFALVTSYEEWEDADEDGRHGGVDLVLTVEDGGRDIQMDIGDVQDLYDAQKEEA